MQLTTELWLLLAGGLALGTASIAALATAGVLRRRATQRQLADHAANQALCRRLEDERTRADELAAAQVAAASARADAEAALADREAALADRETALRARDEFLAMLGHELRNPLAPIQTALELMRMRPDRPHERERAVIERQTTHLVRLVDDMLDITRIARGKVELQRERVELGELIAKAVEVAGPLVEERSHQLITEIEHAVAIDGDAARLVQVFANLVTNAAKYTEPRGQIRLAVVRDGDHGVITVRDNGRGIDAEVLPHVFDMFVQQGRRHEGLGLGLAIVHRLVELHGGTVTASSPGLNQGSEFVVRLPLAEPLRLARPASVPPPEDNPLQPVVLVVDDNTDAAELLADLLRNRGCAVHVASDSSDALHLATELVPDVAVLDIGLPVMDGYELARRLRALPAWRDVRLIALTGYGHDHDRKRSTDAGFQFHLVKPVDAARIVQLVHEGDAVPVAIN